MKKVRFILSTLLLVSIFTSCNRGKSVFTPTSSGRPYEVIVVVDDSVWNRAAGRALFDVLDTDVPGLPQSERSFRISYTAPRNFDNTLRIIRNIIIVDIRNIYTAPKFKVARDEYATPQLILTIQAPDEEGFEEFVRTNSQTIIDLFTRAEMNRQISLLEKKHNEYVSTKVASMFDCQVWVPTELSNTKTGEDFLWASTNTATSDMNFVIYSYPYTDQNTFTREYIMHKRDSVMKANIPGSREGMYMATDTITVSSREINVQKEYTLEMRGLWHVKGDFMGGPFVSHTRLDRANQRIITAEIFIYSPDKAKRNLVRLMEASLYTLRLPSEESMTEIPLDVNQ